MPSDMTKGMTRREFITRGAGAVAGMTILGSLMEPVFGDDTPARKPNVVFVFADQMRNCNLACMGNPDIKTPNMDKLASQGMLFSNATTAYPLCSPYRATLITGRYPISNGVVTNDVPLPKSEITIAKVLKEQGYKTGYVGKWHLGEDGTDASHQGFDCWQGKGLEPVKTDSDYKADHPTSVAIQFMKEHKDEPFCLFLSWNPPHPPYIPPKRYENLYDPKKLKLRPNVQDESNRENIAKSYEMITGLDDNVGKIIKALDELGIAEDTIFCFSSDHGDMLGSQDRQNKNLPWEESANIPFIMRYPRKVKAGQKTDLLLNSVDVMPTLLSMCGVSIPKTVEGTDLSGIILGKGGKEPESQFLLDVIPGPTGLRTGVDTWRAVRTKRYTYARLREKGWLLYDREKDPYQMNNLIDKPEHKEIQDKMEATLQEWLKKTNDKFESKETWWTRIGRKGDPLSGAKEKAEKKSKQKNSKSGAK